jgi:hypothetical protein
MRFGAAVLGFVSACSFPHGSLQDTDDAQGSGSGSGSGQMDAAIDAKPDARPDSPPAQPVTMTFAVGADTYVDSLNQSTAFGTAQNMFADGATQEATALVRADLSSIPTTALVQSAVLHVWASNDVGAPVTVYQMLESWDEGSATWIVRSTGVGWSGIGASPPSRSTAALATLPTATAFYEEKTGTIPNSVVQGWVSAPATNFGLALVTADTDGSAWRTRENNTAENHPILVVTYRPQ